MKYIDGSLTLAADGRTDDTAALLAAIASACSGGLGCLVLPPGRIIVSQDIVLPAGWTGCLTIRGAGRRVTSIVQTAAGKNGLNFNLSAGTPALNSVELSDFGVIAQASAACATAVILSYGAANIPSSESNSGSVLRYIEVNGGGWTNGVDLWNAWHSDVDHLYLFGNPTGWAANPATPGDGSKGAGSGVGFRYRSGVNNTIGKITAEFWSQAWRQERAPGTTQDCQGTLIETFIGVQCMEMLHAYGSGIVNGLSALNLLSFVLDNGNIAQPYLAGMIFEGLSNFNVGHGSVYQNGGPAAIVLSNCYDGTIEAVQIEAPIAVGLSMVAGTKGVKAGKLTCNGQALGCSLDPTTSNNVVTGISATNGLPVANLDLGTNNRVGNPIGPTGVIVFQTSGLTETLYMDISAACLGKKPNGDTLQVTSDQIYCAQYNWDDPASSATTAAIRYWRRDGLPVVPGNASRVTCVCCP